MVSTQEFKGKWWLPTNEDDKVSGTLYYSPSESILLELIGNFMDASKDGLSSIIGDNRVPVIHGQASDGSDISLFNCGCSINRVFKADFPIAKYHPRAIAIGIHISSIKDKCFFKAVVKIPELSYWLFPKTVEQNYFTDDDGITSINVKMDKLPESDRTEAKTRLKNGFVLSLTRNAFCKSGDIMFITTLEQFTSLKIECNKGASIKSFYENAVRFEQFLSIATLRDVAYSELTVYSKDCFTSIRNGSKIYNPIRIDTVFHDAPNDKKIENHNFLFNFKDIEASYKDAIKKWFSRDSKFDAIRGHMLESIDYHGHFSYMNFLVVIQALEGFGCRYRNEECKKTRDSRIAKEKKGGVSLKNKRVTLADTIKTFMNEFKDITCINRKIKIASVVDSRHYYSHLTEKVKKNKVEGVKLFELTHDLRKILLCCVLKYLGFNNSDIEKYTKACNNSFIQGYK